MNLNLKEHYSPVPTPAPLPPPAYPTGPSILSIASALYAYAPTDAGDLALQQNDRILVTEHMNNDCMWYTDLSASKMLIEHRVEGPKRKNRSRRNFPTKLCHSHRRKKAADANPESLRLRQHATHASPEQHRWPTTEQARRARKEDWQEDG